MNAEYGIRNVFLVVLLGIVAFVLSRALLFRFSCESISPPENNQATNGFFVDNQVIVTGPRDEVSDIVAPLKLNLIEDCDLSYLNTRNAQNLDRAQGQRNLIQALRQPLVMRLYEIPADQTLTVEDAIAAIQVGNIVADPNYLTSLSDSTTDPCARPTDSGSGGGHPFGDSGVPDPKTEEARKAGEAFMNQWAFGSQGINLPTSSRFAGHDVRVGVFDTSPFRNTRGSVRIAIAQPSPLKLTTIDTPGTDTLVSTQNNQGSHGLFVAGLIHAVAPKSKIQLIRVLNDDGCGQLWVLNKALEDFTSRMSAWTGNLNRTVINMSLGIRMPNPLQKDALNTFRSAIGDADKLGAFIVAAAGNDSPLKDSNGRIVADPAPMQIPADFGNVLGVAATNNEGKRSCYSNKGEVAAPGGDGSPGTNEDGTPNPCVPRADSWDQRPGPNGGSECTDMGQCPYILISLGQTENGPQYVYWSGTSFAAPLVSGLAALAYEEGEKSQVECLIRRGASPLVGATTLDPNNWGIINVTDSLSNAVLSTCGVRP